MLQVDVHNKTGIGKAQVSRIFSGVQDFVTSEDLDAIIQTTTTNSKERAAIVRARWRDAYDGKFAGLLNITVKGGAIPAERFTPNDVSINPRVNAAFDFLYNLVPSNPQIGELMILQAVALGMTG